MKFRYKVLMINFILLSVSLGVVGYLMIRKNFELAQNTQLQNAIMENSLVQSSVEYELLQVLNTSNYHIESDLLTIGNRVANSIQLSNSAFYIRYGLNYVYTSDGQQNRIQEELFDALEVGGKNYLICREDGGYSIYVTSCNNVDGKMLYIISRCDASQAYQLMETQIIYFRYLLIGVLLVASVIMFAVSIYLTRPLEKLNDVTDQIASGNYRTQVQVSSHDEIGNLAAKFNLMAQAVADHVDELNEMIHRRDQFVADFTHEIKTPMTAIIGYADTLRSIELPREEQIMALNYIFSEGKRLETMSGKLFELIYLRQHEIEMSAIHTEDLRKEIETIVPPLLVNKNITLEIEMEAAVLMGNRELLVTVLINLIDNARKASDEGGRIFLAGHYIASQTDREKKQYEVTVTDQGIGMSKEDAKRICDEFYMVDKSRARREGGAGIGMSLVALILERHEAQLLVESELGKGTVMRILFSGTSVVW